MNIKLQITNVKFQKLRLLELFAHLTLITVLVLVTARPISAQTITPAVMMEKEGTGAATQEASPAAKNRSDYQLPYAGLLPDHPLYVLKTLRDRIVDFLITDPVKKADFTLLAADKRLAAAVVLVEKGKPELAESTASKGETYLSRSISLVKQAKSEGKETTTLVTKLKSALIKHEEVLGELAARTSGPAKERFTAMKVEAEKHRQSL